MIFLLISGKLRSVQPLRHTFGCSEQTDDVDIDCTQMDVHLRFFLSLVAKAASAAAADFRVMMRMLDIAAG